MTHEKRIEKALELIGGNIDTDFLDSLLLYGEELETLTQLLKGNIKELKIRDFKKTWEGYEERIDIVLKIINDPTLNKEQQKESIKEYFKELDKFFFMNCSDPGVEDDWGDVSAMKEGALDILDTENYDLPDDQLTFKEAF